VHSLQKEGEFHIDALRTESVLGAHGKLRSWRMRTVRLDRLRAKGSEFKDRASGEACESEPFSPTDYLARLGALILVAACFGMVAQFLAGAP
jgi:hypothetical protein